MIFGPLPRQIGVAAITGYQKHISPHKGFNCAHRLLYGGESCSQYIKRVLSQEGFAAAWFNSRKRFQACKQANQILRMRRERSLKMASSDTDSLEIPEQEQKTANSSTKKAKSPGFCDHTNNLGDCCLDGGSNCTELITGMTDCSLADCTSPDCSNFDCSSPDCGNFDCNCLDCGSCGN